MYKLWNFRRTDSDVEDELVGIIVQRIGEMVWDITGISSAKVIEGKKFVDDLEIDSLSMVEIAVQTEDKYGIKIPDEDLAKFNEITDAINYALILIRENPEASRAIARSMAFEDEPRVIELVDLYIEETQNVAS